MSRYGNYKSAIDFVPKLELKHIVGYLPFGLSAEYKEYLDDNKTDLGAFSTVEITGVDFHHNKILIRNGFVTERDSIKPILRPISDLTKEIEVNGKKFVPIVEIIKKVSLIDLSDCFFDVFFEDGHYSVNAETANRSRVLDCIYFDGNIFSAIDNGGDFDYLNPQTEAYEFLDKLHFDWKYSLIEKGLAIDINALP